MVKLKVKSHVQQERNMAGVGNKFAPLPPILLNKKKGEPYKPKTPEDAGGSKNPFARQLPTTTRRNRQVPVIAWAACCSGATTLAC